VLLAWRCPDGVAGAHADDRAVAVDDQSDALDDVQGLADGVGVPVGAGTGRESLAMSRDGSSDFLIGVTYTSPVKFAAGVLAVLLTGVSSIVVSFFRVVCSSVVVEIRLPVRPRYRRRRWSP
jgi:hypothetical protein